MNTLPRKALCCKTPEEVFDAHLDKPTAGCALCAWASQGIASASRLQLFLESKLYKIQKKDSCPGMFSNEKIVSFAIAIAHLVI